MLDGKCLILVERKGFGVLADIIAFLETVNFFYVKQGKNVLCYFNTDISGIPLVTMKKQTHELLSMIRMLFVKK